MRRITLLTIICIMAILPLGPALTVHAQAKIEIKSAEFDKETFELTIRFENKSDVPIELTKGILGNKELSTISSGLIDKGKEGTVIITLDKDPGREVVLDFKTNLGNTGTQTIQVDSSPNNEAPLPPIPEKPEFEDTTKKKPILHLAYNSSMPEAKAGQTVKFSLPIKNNSNYVARSVMMNIGIGESSKNFVFDRLNLTHSLDSIQAYATKHITLEVKVDPNTPAGVYPLTLNFDYTNEYRDAYQVTETAYIKVENTNTAPRLMLGQVKKNPESIKAGDAIKLELDIKNNGNLPAKNIQVSLKGLSKEGLTLLDTTPEKYIASLNGLNTAKVEYTLQASKDIEGGNQSLELSLNYEDEQKQTYSQTNQFFVKVEGAENSKPDVVIEAMQSPGAIEANQEGVIRFQLVNKGVGEARNIKVALSHDKELIPKSLNTVMLSSLKPGEKKELSFTISATTEAESKNYPVAIQVEYEGAKAQKENAFSATQYVGLYVHNQVGSDKAVPKIIIDQYSIAEGEAKAGENIHLHLSFLNTNKQISVNNLKISFTSEEGIFTTVGSNSFFFEQIAPQGRVTEEVVFSIKPDAVPKVHHLTVDFDYADDKGNPHTAKEMIGIPINQDPRLTLGEVNTSPEAFVGQPVPVFVEFYNMGKSTLYNLMISVEGDFQSPLPSYYVGNFESGKTDSFDEMVIPSAPGEVNGQLVFTFEDHAGKQTEIRKDLTLQVMDMANFEDPSDQGMFPEELEIEDDSKISTPLIITLIGIGVALIIGVVVVWRKRQIRKKGMEFDEFS